MEKYWKIKNLTNESLKVAVSIASNAAPGVILQPNQFCIARQQMTAPLDKQIKCRKASIEDFDNVFSLDMAKAYDESFLDKEKQKIEDYAK